MSDASDYTPTSSEKDPQSVLAPSIYGTGVRFLIPMPYPGAADAPYFDGANVTDFTEKFDVLCSDRGLIERERCTRMVKYCEPDVRQYIETLPEFIDKNWKALLKTLKEEYARQDETQLRFTRPYLEAYIRKPRQSVEDVLTYCRTYAGISKKLINTNRLDVYTQFSGFLVGLPEEFRKEVMTKTSIQLDNITEADFETVKQAAVNIAKSRKKLDEILDSTGDHLKIKELVNRSGKGGASRPIIDPKPQPQAIPVVPVIGAKPNSMTYSDHLNRRMDDMTRQLEAMALSMSTRPIGPNGGYGGPASTTTRDYQQDRLPPSNCFYCGGQGHYLKRECSVFNEDLRNQRVHMNDGKIGLGPWRRDSLPITMKRGFTQRECVEHAEKLSYGKRQPEEANANVSTVRVDSFCNDVASLSTDDEDDDLPEGLVLSRSAVAIKAARTEKLKEEAKDAWRTNQKTILKRKIKDETKLAKPRSLRHGSWKPTEEQVIKEEAEIAPSMAFIPKDNMNYRSYVEEASDEDAVMTEAPIKAKSVKFAKNPTTPITSTTSTAPTASTDTKAKPARPLDSYKESYSDSIMTDRVLKTEIPMPLAWILNHWPEVMKTLSNKPLKILAPEQKGGEVRAYSISHDAFPTTLTKDHYAIATPRAPIRFNSEMRYEALLDTGAEINVMTKKIAMQEDLPIRANPSLNLVSHTGHRKAFIGVCEDVLVNIGGMRTRVPIFVVDEADHKLVLGQPFFVQSKCKFKYKEDGIYAEVQSKDGSAIYTFKATDVGDKRYKKEKDVFPHEPDEVLEEDTYHQSLNY